VKIQESGENYLETVLRLQHRNGYVRSIDIANEMEYSKPSISRAMHILEDNGLIIMETSGQIVLTEKGREKAEAIFERHEIISKFLNKTLGIEADLAEQDACKIEHIISEETFAAIKEFYSKSIITNSQACLKGENNGLA